MNCHNALYNSMLHSYITGVFSFYNGDILFQNNGEMIF
jgi:hypothetical protein